MERLITSELKNWQTQHEHMPLILRGARQVGKTYLVEQFAEQNFTNLVTANFEFQPGLADAFTNLDPQQICKKLSLLTGQEIIPGQTLLFLDEIQECPQAIMALRYFKEKMPALHVISAGSLLEFILDDESLRMPVGRVHYMYLKPLSFYEYLLATGRHDLYEFLNNITLKESIPTALHELLLSILNEFIILGGMPNVIKYYLREKNILAAERQQTSILTTYNNDFGKYASKANHKYLQLLFNKAPGLVAQHFKYIDVDPDIRAREIKTALTLLQSAGIINKIKMTQASGLPLSTQVNEKKFKLLFLDIGLTLRASQIDAQSLLQDDTLLLNRGALAEQFVGQELAAYATPYEEYQHYYWQRDVKSSSAEVDYLAQVGKYIIPIEVKAGKTGRLKSMHTFLREKQQPVGVRISQHPLNLEKNVLSVPLYMINELPRLVRDIID